MLLICRNFVYKIKLLKTYNFNSLFIISVGNLSVGGTGKTPFVFLFSQILQNKNIEHAIVSRGYKRKLNDLVLVSNKNKILVDYNSSGDEPQMLAQMLPGVPVVVGNKRKAICEAEKNFSINSIISHIVLFRSFYNKSANYVSFSLSSYPNYFRTL